MKKLFLIIIAFVAVFSLNSCDEESSLGPNEIGGSTDLEYTKPGYSYAMSISLGSNYVEQLNNLKDSIWVAKNDNGIVTTKGKFELDIESFRKLDTMYGTYTLPRSLKLQAIDSYVKLFNGTLDTSNLENIKVTFELKNKVTSEGIQGFVYSKGKESRPFTIVKYDCKVGDKYEFVDDDGKKHTRTVISKATTEDWNIGFLNVKSIKVEEKLDDPVFDKVVYVTNHKFGFVGLIVTTKQGKVTTVKVF